LFFAWQSYLGPHLLEQGVNVKVCTFPKGEDPDSFAKQKTTKELKDYLNENTKDFISYKASLLMEQTANDPIAKADLIRNMVISISKISDQIKQELYVRECARIMDISEHVLFSTLAQILKKTEVEANKNYHKEKKTFEVVKANSKTKKINIQYEMEQKIIEILLLYGNRTEDFEDLILKENDENVLVLEPITQKSKVFEKIYLDLQEDEMEFSNADFKTIYYLIIDNLNQTDSFSIENFVQIRNSNTKLPSIV
jgi:DNA primase